MRRVTALSPLRHIDIVLGSVTLAIAALGVLMVYSATKVKLQTAGLDPQLYLKRQAVWVALGLGALVVSMVVDYRLLRELAPFGYAAVALGLVLVLSPAGSTALGSQRWFNLGPFQLQPSAFASLALVILLAAYIERERTEFSLPHVVVCVALAVVLMGLVSLQPDLGSAIVVGAALLAVLTVAGVRPRYLVILVVAAAVSLAVVTAAGVFHDYQLARVTAFLHQSGSQATYNLTQSKISIASGGLVGRGLFQGTQTNLSFVPEQQTDFIFTVVGEELGLVGSVTLIALYGVLVWRVWRAANLARDLFGTLLCAGVLGILVTQIFENTGMTMGIMPITGIPLPLLSYGGSSTIVMFAAIGVVLNVHMHRFAPAQASIASWR